VDGSPQRVEFFDQESDHRDRCANPSEESTVICRMIAKISDQLAVENARLARLLDRRKVNENALAGGLLSFPDRLSLPTEG
jgi:hypothetical protein